MGLTFSRLTSGKPYVAGCGEVVEKTKPGDADMALAEKLATLYEPKITKAVLSVLDAHAEALDMDALIAALQTGHADQVLAVVDAAMAHVEAAMTGKMMDALQDAMWGAGAAALAPPNTPPSLRRVEFHFDRINPALVQWLQEYDLALIRQINSTTREAVRDVLIKNITLGKGPAAQAVQIKDTIGLTTRQGAAVSNFRKELETFHLKRSAAGWGLGKGPDKVNGHNVFKPGADGLPKDGVLNRRLRELRFDPTLEKAMATRKPLTPKQIDKMVEAYARRYRAHRATVIARTESMRTTNAGIHEAFRQAIEKGLLSEDLVRRRFIVTDDERLCEFCAPIPGMNPPSGVKFAQPFATPLGPIMLGPIHPSCRCTVFYYTIEPQALGVNGGSEAA